MALRSKKISKDLKTILFSLIVVVAIYFVRHGAAHRIGDDPYHRGAILDSRERYRLEWRVTSGRIQFNVTVQTKGWILFGLANNGDERTGRDLVIGGVDQKGQAYFSDRHTGRFNERWERDINQDYKLDSSWETITHTFLSFSRDVDTCDTQDYPITENKLTIIWAYGDRDDEEGDRGQTGVNGDSGSYDVYLLDPEHARRVIRQNLYDQVPRVTGSESPITQIWTINKKTPLSRNDTSYQCSIHKAPTFTRKHHIIGFDVKFADEQSRRHVHHLIVQRCQAPQGSSAVSLFDSFAQSGQHQSCFSIYRPATGNMPTHFCTQVYMVWALGGRAFFVPDHVGFPFGEQENEYYMAQIHYDNPTQRSGVTVSLNLDFFYTQRLRPNEAGIMAIGHNVPGLPTSLLIPPQTTNARVFGHCGGDCTKRILPSEGITLVAALLHSHMSGRQLRLHHFRRNEELPWILYDDNYSNEYQQVRALPRGEVQLLPGDQLTMDCTYDNTWTNSTVLGGFRTRQEMCLSYVVYYNLLRDYSYCRSEIISPAYRQRFLGVRNVTWMESHIDWVAMPPSPRFLVGRTVTDISDSVEWDKESREELQQVHEQHPQTMQCSRDLHSRDAAEVEQTLQSFPDNSGGLVFNSGDYRTSVDTENDYIGPVEYPRSVIPYEIPEDDCVRRGIFSRTRNS